MVTLYQQILGTRFGLLDAGVQRFHLLQGVHRLKGCCSIRGADSWAGHVICTLLGLPHANPAAAMQFELNASEHAEVWIRHFPHRTMRSVLRAHAGGLLIERIGPARLLFSLSSRDGQLSMRLRAIRIFGLPWPKCWFPEIWAVERGNEDRFQFDVGARFRRSGLIVAYSGHLELPPAVANS